MLLEVVTLTWDVGSNLETVREANTSNLTDSRVRLLRSLCGYLRANASLKWRRVEGWSVLERVEAAQESCSLRLASSRLTVPSDELIDGSQFGNEKAALKRSRATLLQGRVPRKGYSTDLPRSTSSMVR